MDIPLYRAEDVGANTSLSAVRTHRRDPVSVRWQEDKVSLRPSGMNAVVGAHVADIELNHGIDEIDANIFLFLFITGKKHGIP